MHVNHPRQHRVLRQIDNTIARLWRRVRSLREPNNLLALHNHRLIGELIARMHIDHVPRTNQRPPRARLVALLARRTQRHTQKPARQHTHAHPYLLFALAGSRTQSTAYGISPGRLLTISFPPPSAITYTGPLTAGG